jgi:hypothetical protein
MAERKNTDFDRPGGYATPKGAAHVQRRATSKVAEAGISLYGDGRARSLASRRRSSLTTPTRASTSATAATSCSTCRRRATSI